MSYKTTLLEQVHDHVASAIPVHYIPMSEEESKARSLVLSAQTFEQSRDNPPPFTNQKG